jgi:predicted CXXCH cytochrome family protein
MTRSLLVGLFIGFATVLFTASRNQAAEKNTTGSQARGTVQDKSGQAIPKATVYLIPAADVVALRKAPSIEIRKNVTNDEPMEDNLAANRDKYQKATTDQKGNFTIPKVAAGNYFIYVEPSDREHLPGGDQSNKAISASVLSRQPVKILLSGRIPENATYVGTSQCLMCHQQYASEKKTLHKLGISVIGKPSGLQDYSRFPNFNDGVNKLMAGAKFYFYNFDKGRGFDKYLLSEKMPTERSSISFSARFFKDGDGKLKFTTENLKDPSDPPRTYTVEMTYGGGLYKQRYLFRVNDSLYPFLQYNTLGNDSYNDRTRKPWRDYHADWLFDENTNKLADPPAKKSFEIECASCHFTGYTLTPTAGGGFVAGAVNDPNGEIDIDGDGIPNELNMGCEVCHGPGSEHVKSPQPKKAATIVNPGKLASERATVICNQCHSRPQGNLKNDQPVSKENRMLIPGVSRNEYLVNHTTREDAAQTDFWPDKMHSRSHHQQGTDFVRSKKYINETQLMTCSTCHDPHGMTEVKHQLRQPVRDGKNTLCSGCHKDSSDVQAHTAAKVGVPHAMQINCVDCHNPKTMLTGAGLGKGLERKDGGNYWMNDITSHLFIVPRKTNVGVKGAKPGGAMPIPYTSACGACHNPEG